MALFGYQREDVEKISSAGGRMLIASEVGTGKTVTALTAADRLGTPWLIVCPAGLRFNWRAEIEKWFPELLPRVSVLLTAKDEIAGDIVITSFELATRLAPKLVTFDPRVIVVDEAHGLKNPLAKRTKALVPLCRRAPHCLLLTGTPMVNRPIELWPLLTALIMPGLERYVPFGVRYAAGKKVEVARGREVWDFTGASNLPELSARLVPHMIRRRKADVLADLPEKRRVKMVIESAKIDERAVRAACRAALRHAKGDADRAFRLLRGDRDKAGEALACLFEAHRRVGTSKVSAAAQWVVDNATAESPLVVYAHHLGVLKTMKDQADAAGLRTGVIIGSVQSEERQAQVEAFQAGRLDVLFCGITAANSGMTLTRASEMLVVELPWSPKIAEQCEGRIHRIGSSRGVTIRYCVSEASIDRIMWSMLTRKSENAGQVVDGDRHADRFDADEVDETGGSWEVIKGMLLEEAA